MESYVPVACFVTGMALVSHFGPFRSGNFRVGFFPSAISCPVARARLQPLAMRVGRLSAVLRPRSSSRAHLYSIHRPLSGRSEAPGQGKSSPGGACAAMSTRFRNHLLIVIEPREGWRSLKDFLYGMAIERGPGRR